MTKSHTNDLWPVRKDVPQRYVLIPGCGRSGSTWLLRLLDISPCTFCRNEPLLPSARNGNEPPSHVIRSTSSGTFASYWDGALRHMASCMGDHDYFREPHKAYYRPVASHVGLPNLLRRHRTRRLLSLVAPSIRGVEWPVPRWLVNIEAFQASLPIVKSCVPAWGSWVLEHRTCAIVIHMVRHPGAFLDSWHRRYLASHDPARVRNDNFARMKQVLLAEPEWGSYLSNLESMTVEELELWYWRYANEIIYEAGQDSDGYLRITYEQLASDPAATTRMIYSRCGLEWNRATEASVLRMSHESRAIADRWRTNISRKHRQLVDHVLADSVMDSWWDPSYSNSVACRSRSSL